MLKNFRQNFLQRISGTCVCELPQIFSYGAHSAFHNVRAYELLQAFVRLKRRRALSMDSFLPTLTSLATISSLPPLQTH